MYLSSIPEGTPCTGQTPSEAAAALSGIASGLDARFVAAGNALSRAYEIVERLVAALDEVTHALDGDSAEAVIAQLRKTAERLISLPTTQAERQVALGSIGQVSKALRVEVAQVTRLLSFLRICGLNIKVAAAGANGFSDFADTIFAKLDIGEREIADMSRDIDLLVGGIAAVLDVDRQLAAECRHVIPHVPAKLVEDALALGAHQSEAKATAARIAEVARVVHSRVGTALGAMQIGDITRQRLEHLAAGIEALEAYLAARPEIDAGDADAIRGHVLALIAAQAEDTAADLARESRLLEQNVQAIMPSAQALLALKDEGGDGGDDSAILVLERSVAEIAAVTAQLRLADARASELGRATSATAAGLTERMRQVRRMTDDVQHMAWNTDLRCNRMGYEGRALAMVASEIRGFAATLETISSKISTLFGSLSAAAAAIRGGTDEASSGGDSSLGQSLARIREGGEKLRCGMAALQEDAASVKNILAIIGDNVDCGEMNAAMATLVAGLAPLGTPLNEPAERIADSLAEFLASLADSYTMAREREIHRRFRLGDGATPAIDEAACGDPSQDEDDDGLF